MRLLIEPSAVSKIDAAAIRSGIDSYRLMYAAGSAVAAAALKHWPGALRFVVLAGPGNNGGDGHVAAGVLRQSGAVVAVYEMAPPATADARRAAAESGVGAEPIGAYLPRAGDVVIDALFGAGLGRDLSPEIAGLIAGVEDARLPVLAVDMPSGIDGHSGAIRGAAFRATRTVTFMALKPGQILLPGREYCGEIEIAEIGVPQRLVAEHACRTVLNDPANWSSSARGKTPASHKYTHGALVVFSGPSGRTGAARLSAAAGLRAGAGLVTVASPSDAMAENAAHLTAVMLHEVDDRAALRAWLADRRLSTFVLGPAFGIGEKTREFVAELADRRLVLDADGLTAFRDRPQELFDLFAEDETRLILTPHAGEFARLFPDLAEDETLSKVERAQAAAERAHAAVILKGADTVIAEPGGRAAINTNAPPWLATAGSGDVLAGICGGLLAQGYPAFEAACAAVWHHGEAASRAGRGLTAETLINFIDM